MILNGVTCEQDCAHQATQWTNDSWASQVMGGTGGDRSCTRTARALIWSQGGPMSGSRSRDSLSVGSRGWTLLRSGSGFPGLLPPVTAGAAFHLTLVAITEQLARRLGVLGRWEHALESGAHGCSKKAGAGVSTNVLMRVIDLLLKTAQTPDVWRCSLTDFHCTMQTSQPSTQPRCFLCEGMVPPDGGARQWMGAP